MKKNLFYLFAIVFMAVGVTACSSSDDDSVSNEKVVGVWELNGALKEDNTVESSPLLLNIKRKAGVADKDFIIMGLLPGETAMELGSSIAGGLIMSVLEEINFKDNLNIVAKYKELKDNKPTGEWLTSPDGLATYKCLSGDRLLLSLDSKAIIKEANLDNEIIEELIRKFLGQSLKLQCVFNEDLTTMTISVDLLSLTQKNIRPVFDSLLQLPDDLFEAIGGKDFFVGLSKELPVMFDNASKFEASILLKR